MGKTSLSILGTLGLLNQAEGLNSLSPTKAGPGRANQINQLWNGMLYTDCKREVWWTIIKYLDISCHGLSYHGTRYFFLVQDVILWFIMSRNPHAHYDNRTNVYFPGCMEKKGEWVNVCEVCMDEWTHQWRMSVRFSTASIMYIWIHDYHVCPLCGVSFSTTEAKRHNLYFFALMFSHIPLKRW